MRNMVYAPTIRRTDFYVIFAMISQTSQFFAIVTITPMNEIN